MRSRDVNARGLTRALVALALYDGALLALAFVRRDDAIRDGASSVTSGALVAGGIVATFALVASISLMRLPMRVARHAQVFGLAAQALHATGHLAGWYYAFRPYDDVLHAFLTGWLGIVSFEAARSWRVIPAGQVTPLRQALIVLFAGIALAGVWEIFEYAADNALRTREQDDLADTMEDMIAGAVGSLVVSITILLRGRKRDAPRSTWRPRVG